MKDEAFFHFRGRGMVLCLWPTAEGTVDALVEAMAVSSSWRTQ